MNLEKPTIQYGCPVEDIKKDAIQRPKGLRLAKTSVTWHTRQADSRVWQFLIHGSQLSGFFSFLCSESLDYLFHRQSQVKTKNCRDLFSLDKFGNRLAVRSNDLFNRFLFYQGIFSTPAPRNIFNH